MKLYEQSKRSLRVSSFLRELSVFEEVPVDNPVSSSLVIKLLGGDKGEICSTQKILKKKRPRGKERINAPYFTKWGTFVI